MRVRVKETGELLRTCREDIVCINDSGAVKQYNINEIEFIEDNMKAKLKDTGEIIDVSRSSDGMYIQENPRQWRYPHELDILGYTTEEVENIKSRVKEQCTAKINWEQRRFDLIKAVLQGLSANENLNNSSFETVANIAIEQADIVIEKLKAE